MRTVTIGLMLALSSGLVIAENQETSQPKQVTQWEKRSDAQDKRIQQGIVSGQLTEKEVARLGKSDTRVESAQAKALADGKITRNENKRINNMYNKQGKQIHREKHDKQRT